MARELIRIVSSDAELPRHVRRRASRLQGLASSKPSLVVDELESLRQEAVPGLAMESPTCDYARCVSVESFWRHNLATERREAFVTPNDYLHWLTFQRDPGAAAMQDMTNGDVVPAPHSWLVPAARIEDLDGLALKARLKLADSEPPFLVFLFPLANLLASLVRVRKPRGLDTVPARHVQWSPGDVPDERIDLDIPYAALGGIQWRP